MRHFSHRSMGNAEEVCCKQGSWRRYLPSIDGKPLFSGDCPPPRPTLMWHGRGGGTGWERGGYWEFGVCFVGNKKFEKSVTDFGWTTRRIGIRDSWFGVVIKGEHRQPCRRF